MSRGRTASINELSGAWPSAVSQEWQTPVAALQLGANWGQPGPPSTRQSGMHCPAQGKPGGQQTAVGGH